MERRSPSARLRLLVPAAVGLGGLLAGLLAWSSPRALDSAPAAWIDTPIDGSVHAPGTLRVIAHATDASGVTSIELTANGTPVGVAGGLGGSLAHASFDVELDAGDHILVAIGTGGGGVSRSAPVVVHVGQPAEPSTTTSTTTTTAPPPTTLPPTTPPPPPPTTSPPQPSTTTSPTTPPTPPTTTTTTTTTLPPCELVAPTPVSPDGGAEVNAVTITFVWRYAGGCEPGGFVIQVSQDRTFGSIVASGTVGVGARQATLDVACAAGTWVWRVAAMAPPPARGDGPWSPVGVFNRTACRAV